MKFLPFALLFIAVIGLVVMGLWNALIPPIFGWHSIGYWQALGLIILSKILFGGFHPSGRGGRWRHRLMERVEQMTPEEREKFRQGLESRWGCTRPAQDSQIRT